mmetsp:Transcript_43695/g.100863  ORF Transcript_43695/g.100863 Transcript_43695/m.100863 type:complete len:149 (-) Transcript_43695:103-549(-)
MASRRPILATGLLAMAIMCLLQPLTFVPAGSTSSVAGGLALPGQATGLVGASQHARTTRTEMRAKEYWEGEWICADCGYIYNERAFGGKFEDQGFGFKCPNCAAPRRRFARKLGDKIGTTLDGGDTPIIIFTGVCLVLVVIISYLTLQ